MRILLTGPSGQVGWELARSLAQLGEVIGLDRSRLDLSQPDALRETVRAIAPTAIVNAAAYTAVDRAESEPELARMINTIAPGVLAEEAQRLDAILVHYSTDYVFDGTKSEPYVEADATNPLNVYGRTKLEGERAIGASGCRHLTLRTSWVYGARGSNFLLTMLRLAREPRAVLRIVDDQIGAPTWSREIAQATAALLARPELAARGAEGLYHLTASGATSWCGFAQAIFGSPEMARLGVVAPALEAIPTSAYKTPAQRPANSRLDCGRLFSRAGVRLAAWDDALARCLAEVD
ncbi:MAG TPA: dTDP-4-dehydrorhamnose reductase [Candidatus Binatia bacterium]|nr:dTDP-4-dehydrorhamnose reductase [Candidatus Binatia bacterium]